MDKKIYCNKCKHHIDFIEALQNNNEDGRDICRLSLSFEKTPAGQMLLKRNVKQEICSDCGSVLSEKGNIIYTKCNKRNREFNCSDFIKKNKWELFKNLLKKIKRYAKIIYGEIKIKNVALFFIWGIFHTWLIIIKGILNKDINQKLLILYVIISIIFFVGYIKNKEVTK